jgi:hypothetical protein
LGGGGGGGTTEYGILKCKQYGFPGHGYGGIGGKNSYCNNTLIESITNYKSVNSNNNTAVPLKGYFYGGGAGGGSKLDGAIGASILIIKSNINVNVLIKS